MPEKWRTAAARELAQIVRGAGGRAQPIGLGRMLVTGPHGQVTIAEPDNETRNQLKTGNTAQLITEHTGLVLDRSQHP